MVFVLARRSRQVVPEELLRDPKDCLSCLVMVGWKGKDVVKEGCGQGRSCRLELSVELLKGEFVTVVQFLFDAVYDTFHSVRVVSIFYASGADH